MKLIEAMKKVKSNKAKIVELQERIKNSCSNLQHETPVYGEETSSKVSEWIQSCEDICKENIRLMCCIQDTNLKTIVNIEIGGKIVSKSIAAWIWRRREYSEIDYSTWSMLTDRGLKEGIINTSTGSQMEIKIQRHFDPSKRDEMRSMYKEEKAIIDSTLEVINAVTDLIE